ncbi:hypothetical protein ACQEVF_59690 [Nonomuraea polychroma]|uniref:hypothetical protein n=1 Tax=Nonomuraea polychroma TaxID=46176 RepID=UPI003D9197DE
MIVPTVHIAGPVQLGLGGLRQECAVCRYVLLEEFPEAGGFAPEAAETYEIGVWDVGAEVVVQGDAMWVKDRGHAPALDKIAMECGA